MEHHAAAKVASVEGKVVSAFTGTRRASRSNKSTFPAGISMLCGDARYRENRVPDSEVIGVGTVSTDLWFIRSGILRLQRHAYDGRRQILSLFLPGEIIGFEGEFRNGVSIETVTQSALCRIDQTMFANMMNKNDELRAEFFRQKQDQLGRLHWLTWSLGALSPEERFCAFLALSTRFMPYQALSDGSAILTMQLPRADIADLLGTTVETICRINKKLSEAGVIEIKDFTHFKIPDLKQVVSRGRIDGSFDRLVGGIFERRFHLDSLSRSEPGSVMWL